MSIYTNPYLPSINCGAKGQIPININTNLIQENNSDEDEDEEEEYGVEYRNDGILGNHYKVVEGNSNKIKNAFKKAGKALDPKKNGVANALDPKKNGLVNAFKPASSTTNSSCDSKLKAANKKLSDQNASMIQSQELLASTMPLLNAVFCDVTCQRAPYIKELEQAVKDAKNVVINAPTYVFSAEKKLADFLNNPDELPPPPPPLISYSNNANNSNSAKSNQAENIGNKIGNKLGLDKLGLSNIGNKIGNVSSKIGNIFKKKKKKGFKNISGDEPTDSESLYETVVTFLKNLWELILSALFGHNIDGFTNRFREITATPITPATDDIYAGYNRDDPLPFPLTGVTIDYSIWTNKDASENYGHWIAMMYLYQADQIIKEYSDKYKNYKTDITNLMNIYSSLNQNVHIAKTLNDSIQSQIKEYRTNIDNYKSTLITNDRKTEYESQHNDILSSWSNTINYSYWILAIIVIALLFLSKNMGMTEKISYSIGIILYYFTIQYMVLYTIKYTYIAYNMLPKNAYLNPTLLQTTP